MTSILFSKMYKRPRKGYELKDKATKATHMTQTRSLITFTIMMYTFPYIAIKN